MERRNEGVFIAKACKAESRAISCLARDVGVHCGAISHSILLRTIDSVMAICLSEN